MEIQDAFAISGRGVVAIGAIERGRVKIGDAVEIIGFREPKTATVTGIDLNRKTVSEAAAGDSVGLVLRGVTREDLERGRLLVKPGSAVAKKRFKATLDLLTAQEGGRRTPFVDGYRPQITFRTVAISGTVKLAAGAEAKPGDKGVAAELTLQQTTAIEKGAKFKILEGGRAIGTGTVTAVIE